VHLFSGDHANPLDVLLFVQLGLQLLLDEVTAGYGNPRQV
jgi:hypothetical protein